MSIPSEIGTSLTGREAWEKEYLPRLQWCEERVDTEYFRSLSDDSHRDTPLGMFCGPLMGDLRNLMGVDDLCYPSADVEALYQEIIETMAEVCFQNVKKILEISANFVFAYMWVNICF